MKAVQSHCEPADRLFSDTLQPSFASRGKCSFFESYNSPGTHPTAVSATEASADPQAPRSGVLDPPPRRALWFHQEPSGAPVEAHEVAPRRPFIPPESPPPETPPS